MVNIKWRTPGTVFLAAMIFFAVPISGCGSPDKPADADAVSMITIRSLVESPDIYLNRIVRVRGKLENLGTNYFADLRIVLRAQDTSDGSFVYVRPWLPVELPPLPPGSTRKPPPTMARYLGKKVELVALFTRGALKQAGKVNLLEVRSATILE